VHFFHWNVCRYVLPPKDLRVSEPFFVVIFHVCRYVLMPKDLRVKVI